MWSETEKKLEEDPTKCMKNRIRSRINTSRRIKVDREYGDVNRARARLNTSRRIETDAAYKEQNRARANATTKRLANNTAYRKHCIERATAARKAKLQQKGKYWEQDCFAATIRKTKKRTESEKHCKNYNSRKTKEISAIYTARQMYWIKRRRKLSHNRKEQIKLSQQKKMQSMSSVFLLDVKLLFTKSEISLRKASSKLNTLHRVLSDKVVTCLEKMENAGDPNEEEVTAAFGDVRMHTKSSEPYYYEEVYRRVSAEFPIPVDRSSCARIFTPRAEPTKTTQPHNSDCDDSKDIKTWHCNRDICKINTGMITGSDRLLRHMSSTSANMSVYAVKGKHTIPHEECRVRCSSPCMDSAKHLQLPSQL